MKHIIRHTGNSEVTAKTVNHIIRLNGKVSVNPVVVSHTIRTNPTHSIVNVQEIKHVLRLGGAGMTSQELYHWLKSALKEGDNVSITFDDIAKTATVAASGTATGTVLMRVDSGYIQYSNDDGATWENVIALSELEGPKGEKGDIGPIGPQGIQGEKGEQGVKGDDGADGKDGSDGQDGTDGREIELQKGTTHIEWRYVNEATWTELVALVDLKGDKGDDGQDGQDGNDGVDGREIELQKGIDYVQWRYVGEAIWNDLILISELKGDAGADGADGQDGADGKNIELQKGATHIQWRVVGDIDWIDLIAIEDLKGDKGDTGPGVAAGGTTGQRLRKKSTTDFDTEWVDNTDAQISLTETYTNNLAGATTQKEANDVLDGLATNGKSTGGDIYEFFNFGIDI